VENIFLEPVFVTRTRTKFGHRGSSGENVFANGRPIVRSTICTPLGSTSVDVKGADARDPRIRDGHLEDRVLVDLDFVEDNSVGSSSSVTKEPTTLCTDNGTGHARHHSNLESISFGSSKMSDSNTIIAREISGTADGTVTTVRITNA